MTALYLNVWTAAESAESALPVLVWIHGGGPKQRHRRAGDLPRRAAGGPRGVVVTTNYRLVWGDDARTI